ncbi:MAG: hypothetical protein JW767_02505 [Thermoleophilia bacterium]|nr:hypothetical protein [Thermoleophilia bacterium]
MTASAVPVVLAAPALTAAAAAVFPEARLVALARQEMRPARPFEGRLFATLASLPAGTCVGLVVPLRLVAATGPSAGEPRVAAGESPTGLVAVEDHVNLELRGPLTGSWPAGVPRRFPSMTGRYQPAVVRSAAGPRVYSGGVVAGVGDLARLTPFERAALRCAGCLGAADLIVPPAVVAAYHGHTLAACGVVQGPPIDEE